MAKAFAKAFYQSRAWRELRREVLRRDFFTCECCGGRAAEVHHEIELTPENIRDPAIALNPALLHSLCHDCHTRETKGADEVGAGYVFDLHGQVSPGASTKKSGGVWTDEAPKISPMKQECDPHPKRRRQSETDGRQSGPELGGFDTGKQDPV